MKFETSIHLTNSSEATLILQLEPWGEQIEMPAGTTFVLAAEAEQLGAFEIEYGEGGLTVWAWASAVVKVFCGAEEIGIGSGGERPAVPPVPVGHSVSSFLRSMFGKDREV
jgi:hypothetical protein